MSRPLSRLLVAGTSALSITALTLGLAAPAGAAPITALDGPEGVLAALDEMRESPIFGLIPGATADQLRQIPEQRAPATARVATTASSNVTAEEVSRTETSATFRFTLPAGEVTREGAVLQAHGTNGNLRYSDLGYLTNPVGQDGVDHYTSYAEQSTIGLAMVDLLRENFSITGATAVTGGVNDHLVIPAGRNSFEVTVTSALTESELSSAIEALTGDPYWNYSDSEWILQSRLAFPEPEVWTYGERVDVVTMSPTLAQFPNGANELTAMVTSRTAETELTITRQDGSAFSGNRVLRINNSSILGSGAMMSDAFFELVMAYTPPPLRPANLTTVVSGATPVGDDFYKPNPGTTEVSATTTHDGPTTIEEAQTAFTTWVTGTCRAEMSDPIPGYSPGEEGEPTTWQDILDNVVDGADGEPFDTTPPIYTELKYAPAVLTSVADHTALLRLMIDTMAGDDSGMFANLFDWEAACGVSGGPGGGEGPGDGDDEPGDEQQPASVTLDVPSGGVAGEPITLSATVLDDAGDPVAGQQVTFTIEEEDSGAGTLRAAALTVDPGVGGPTTLTATTGADGVATVQFTPSTSGMLHISASTAGANPVSSGAISLIPVTPAPGDGDGDGDGGGDDDDDAGGEDPSGSGSLGSLFGSLSS